MTPPAPVPEPEPVATYQDDVLPGPGGVMTDEVGVVTGPLTLRTTVLADGTVALTVQYRGAEEWYRVTAGRATLADPDDAGPLHRVACALVTRDDPDAVG
jgi:hypothetical protein